MKKSLSLFSLLLCAYGAYAQMINDSIVQVCAYWGQGDSAVYQCYSYSEKKTEKGEFQVKKNLSEKRIFQVTEMTDSTYTLKVTYDDVVDSTAIFDEAYRVAMKQVAESLSLEVLTDEWGTPLQYYHVDEIMKSTKKFIPIVTKSVLAQCEKKERRMVKKLIKGVFSQMLSSPEFIIQACDDDVLPLLSYHGGAFRLRKRYEIETTIPNVMGEDIPGTEVFYADTLDFDGDAFVVMKSVIKVDSEELLPLMTNVALNLFKSQFSDATALVEFMQKYEKHLQEIHMQASMEIRTTSLIHLNSGWTYAWEYDRDFRVWDDKSDSWEKDHKSCMLIEIK